MNLELLGFSKKVYATQNYVSLKKNWKSVLWSVTPLFSKICLNVQCYPELAQFDKNGFVKLQIRVNCSKTSDIFVFQIYYNAAIKKKNLKLIKHNGKTQ